MATGGSKSPGEESRVAHARSYGLDRFPEVMSELSAGRGFAAHSLLLAMLRANPATEDRRVIVDALAQPRLFAEPPGKAPGLGRLNGIGTGMYGSDAVDKTDGTYAKTRFFSVFWIPLVPIDRWLVQDAQGGGWYFHAKLPATRAMQIHRIVVAAAAAAVVALVMFVAWWSNSHTSLHVVSGLDVAAELTIDDEPAIPVPANGHVERTLTSGPHRFRCTVAGRTIDDRTEDVTGGSGLAAYNVAGSAALWIEKVRYASEHTASREPAKDDPSDFELLAGRVYVRRGAVDYVFREPPKEVSLSSRESRVVKLCAGVEEGGWRAAIGIAGNLHSEPGLAATIARAVALAEPDDADAVEAATTISDAAGPPEEHSKFLAELAAAKRR